MADQAPGQSSGGFQAGPHRLGGSTAVASGQAADKGFDVAIVGYGPAGALAAALLGQAGCKVFVCDQSPSV